VFAAFGDYIVMWDARTGVDRGQLRLPTFREETSNLGQVFNDTDDMTFFFTMKPTINSLLLYQDRLVITVHGYQYGLSEVLDHEPVLRDYLSTRVLIYDTSAIATGGTLSLLGQQDINGYIWDARLIGSNIHVVTMSHINYQTLFDKPFNRMNFDDISDVEYIAQVRREAETQSIPAYVKYLSGELVVYGKIPNIARMSIMQTEWNASRVNPRVYQSGLYSFYMQVSSLDLSLPITTEPSAMAMNISGAFLPFFSDNVYFTVDTLIAAVQGIDFVPNTMDYHEFTYLIAWDLSKATAEVRAVGQVPGALLNTYSMDVIDNIVRIGTTVKTQRWCCDLLGPVNATVTTNDTSSSSPTDANTNDSNSTSPTSTSNPSETTNYIFMLRIPSFGLSSLPGLMEKMGQLELGYENEEFATIRFFDNIAYAVTRLKIDPFYVLDLSDPMDPQILGTLNTSNSAVFLEYLHPINNNNTLLLAVGLLINENGDSSGLQISVLDARNPTQPKVSRQYVVEQNVNTGYMTSAVFTDYHSVRYDPQTQRLILPLSIGNFEDPALDYNGFYVFIVNENEITLTCRIQLADAITSQNKCYYCAGFPHRSMVFHGRIMTMVAHFVQSANLKSCTSEWNLTVSPKDPDSCCDAYTFTH
jgi:hypothetical protein